MITKKQATLPIIFSSRFKDTLNRITHEISEYLLEMENNIQSTYSYIDIGDTSDTVSFIQANKAIDMKNNISNWEEMIWTSKRCNMKIGKFLMSIIGDRFQLNCHRGSTKLKPNDIESFVNKFKIEFSFDEYAKNFQIVEGDDIMYWYNENNYSEYATTSTTLGNSCMRYDRYMKFIKMYSDNPEKIKMLIYKDDNNKLLGRAIIWYLDEPNRIFMDRIYSTEDKIIDLYKKYASLNGWLYKSYQTYGYEHDLVDTSILPHKTIKESISVKLKDDFYRFIPYIDTLQVLDKETNILSNKGEYIGKSKYIHCVGYNGYSVIDRDAMDNNREYRENDSVDVGLIEDDMVFSNYHDRDISRYDARWCDFGNDWVRSDTAIYVFNSGQRYAVPGNSDIIYSEYSSKWFSRDRVVYSDYHRSYIYQDSAIKVWLDKDRNNYALYHKNEYSSYFEYHGYYYVNSIKEQIYVGDNASERYDEPESRPRSFRVRHNNPIGVSRIDDNNLTFSGRQVIQAHSDFMQINPTTDYIQINPTTDFIRHMYNNRIGYTTSDMFTILSGNNNPISDDENTNIENGTIQLDLDIQPIDYNNGVVDNNEVEDSRDNI